MTSVTIAPGSAETTVPAEPAASGREGPGLHRPQGRPAAAHAVGRHHAQLHPAAADARLARRRRPREARRRTARSPRRPKRRSRPSSVCRRGNILRAVRGLSAPGGHARLRRLVHVLPAVRVRAGQHRAALHARARRRRHHHRLRARHAARGARRLEARHLARLPADPRRHRSPARSRTSGRRCCCCSSLGYVRQLVPDLGRLRADGDARRSRSASSAMRSTTRCFRR